MNKNNNHQPRPQTRWNESTRIVHGGGFRLFNDVFRCLGVKVSLIDLKNLEQALGKRAARKADITPVGINDTFIL